MRGVKKYVRLGDATFDRPLVFHVDFTQEEIHQLRCLIRNLVEGSPSDLPKKEDTDKKLTELIKKAGVALIPRLAAEMKGRLAEDVEAFLVDFQNNTISSNTAVLSLGKRELDQHGSHVRSGRMASMLMAREMVGNRGYGLMRQKLNLPNELKKCHEDDLELRNEWTDCAGDIATITWVSNDGFICGTTEHSDAHNQQYNKPGNLALGSCSRGTLRGYADHRIVRPRVVKGENSTDAMIQSQDPWLYTSVVSSDYDALHDRAYTSGFDCAVKIWRAEKSGASMTLLGTWHHQGNVNFVAASKHGSGMVATASDVHAAAVRIYQTNESDISNSAFRSYSLSRDVDIQGNPLPPPDKWAYFPATMQWGIASEVQHLLLVGYSPRSFTSDDNDIPEEKQNSGEICLWDGLTGERWRITAATSLNVFEVLWHPSQSSFIVATAPATPDVIRNAQIKTQIRIFRISDDVQFKGKAFTVVQCLDCYAADINELTIR
jgi:hypothetical protein